MEKSDGGGWVVMAGFFVVRLLPAAGAPFCVAKLATTSLVSYIRRFRLLAVFIPGIDLDNGCHYHKSMRGAEWHYIPMSIDNK